jgi:hypothetical protein
MFPRQPNTPLAAHERAAVIELLAFPPMLGIDT